MAVNKSPAVYILSRAFDGLKRKYRVCEQASYGIKEEINLAKIHAGFTPLHGVNRKL